MTRRPAVRVWVDTSLGAVVGLITRGIYGFIRALRPLVADPCVLAKVKAGPIGGVGGFDADNIMIVVAAM